MIPKILHFTWKTQALPRVMRRYFAGWKRLHPGWEVRLWTDAEMREFVAATYPGLLSTYDGYPRMIQRADAFRYLVLAHLGGVYADLDVEPLRPIDELAGVQAFVGVEPLEHVASDRIHAGLPFLFSNAFMGAVPGHPLFALVLHLLPQLADLATFYSTGPSMLTAAVLRLALADRPAMLLPKVWSPQRDGGLPTRGDDRLKQTLAGQGQLVESDGRAYVSHKWMTTWVKWHQRYTPLIEVGQLPSRGKWWLRRRVLHPGLGQVHISDALRIYADQRPEPATTSRPVFVGIRLDGAAPLAPELGAAIAELDYPPEMLRIGINSGAQAPAEQHAVRESVARAFPDRAADIEFAAGDADANAARAQSNNRLLARGSAVAEKVLLLGGGVRSMPPDALRRLLGVDRPVVTGNLRDASGRPDLAVFLYNWGPNFRILYKLGGVSGAVARDPSFRYFPNDQRAFPLLAMDGVGEDFVLVDRAVIEAGARFAEGVYKLHRNGEAFGIMARDLGFEAAALTGLMVTTAATQASFSGPAGLPAVPPTPSARAPGSGSV